MQHDFYSESIFFCCSVVPFKPSYMSPSLKPHSCACLGRFPHPAFSTWGGLLRRYSYYLWSHKHRISISTEADCNLITRGRAWLHLPLSFCSQSASQHPVFPHACCTCSEVGETLLLRGCFLSHCPTKFKDGIPGHVLDTSGHLHIGRDKRATESSLSTERVYIWEGESHPSCSLRFLAEENCESWSDSLSPSKKL